ncbi:MAG: nicotinate phosphoribosyltransferase [Myxococcota bacterium]
MTNKPISIYRDSLALNTDLYELTMAYGYFKEGMADHEAVFNLHFREHPFDGGYTVAAGLELVHEYLTNFEFRDDDVEYLASLHGTDGEPMFEDAFLEYLRDMELRCDVHAVPEGTVVFPQEPLVRVRGPIIQAQILETALLNTINFQSLIATKAARVCQAAEGDPVLEFGLRRAQGIDGGLSVSRAAYIGGAAGTSNVLAGKVYGIPVKGTHAHSWVMSFDTELESFFAWADAMPNNCVFLVDTYDTLEGVERAIQVGHQLRERGYEMVGIRLDSGDLAYLSIAAREKLDAAGFEDAAIFASSDLDEHIISSLKDQGATITHWGVGTKLATAYDQPALGGVYKLAAIRDDGDWEPKIKLSEQAIKISTPGTLQVRRYEIDGEFRGDMIFDERDTIEKPDTIIDPTDMTRRKQFDEALDSEELLVPIFERGESVYDLPELDAIRDRAAAQLAGFHVGIRRFVNPHEYPVGLERQLHELKTRLILEARGYEE